MLGQYIKNRRILTISLLGFSSGLPLALTGSTLQAWFTQAGVDLLTIGVLSLVGLPYIWKFLWAPVMDRFTPFFLGRRRGWVFITQMGLSTLMLILAHLQPKNQSALMGCLAVFIAFISASQDIAYDAYRTDVLMPKERGLGAAATTFGYRMAMLVSGGLALIFSDQFGWKMTYEIMALLMMLSAIVTWYAPEVSNVAGAPQTFFAAVVKPFKNLLQRPRIGTILLFIFLYKLGDALALALMSPFLLKELGFTLTEVGVAFKIFGLIATLCGVFIGGIVLTRVSLFQALLGFGLAQALSNLLFVLLALSGKNHSLMITSIFIESFCSGVSTAAFVAFLMTLCDARFSATQYACLSALFALGRVIAGPIAWFLVDSIGWINFYWWAFILSFPGLIVLTVLRENVSERNAEVTI